MYERLIILQQRRGDPSNDKLGEYAKWTSTGPLLWISWNEVTAAAGSMEHLLPLIFSGGAVKVRENNGCMSWNILVKFKVRSQYGRNTFFPSQLGTRQDATRSRQTVGPKELCWCGASKCVRATGEVSISCARLMLFSTTARVLQADFPATALYKLQQVRILHLARHSISSSSSPIPRIEAFPWNFSKH
jgi:hypothetical protein